MFGKNGMVERFSYNCPDRLRILLYDWGDPDGYIWRSGFSLHKIIYVSQTVRRRSVVHPWVCKILKVNLFPVMLNYHGSRNIL